MLHVASVCTPCCMLLRVVGSWCAKFETGQTLEQTNPNISFVPWSPKLKATMLDPFAQLFQHCWGDAHALHMISLTNTRDGPTLLGVVASVFTLLPTRAQQLSTLLAQERFQSRDQHLCRLMGTKVLIYIRKELNSHRICLEHKNSRRFIVLEHQYGRRDVMWKRSTD